MELNEQREAKREYDRLAKQRSRAKQKLEKEKLAIPNAHDYVMPDHQKRKLTEYSNQLRKTIAADLGLKNLPELDAYVVDAVASVLFGLENSIAQVVHDPEGVLVGGHFPDALVSKAIEHVHRFPNLLRSTTFANLYRNFLHAVVKWSKKNENCSTPEFIQEAKSEIAGEYVLPPLPELPKPEPKTVPDVPSVPTDSEILERGRTKTLDLLQSQTLVPDARRYLDGL